MMVKWWTQYVHLSRSKRGSYDGILTKINLKRSPLVWFILGRLGQTDPAPVSRCGRRHRRTTSVGGMMTGCGLEPSSG
jgi:hypothetical protein